jgi:hypothetical protein
VHVRCSRIAVRKKRKIFNHSLRQTTLLFTSLLLSQRKERDERAKRLLLTRKENIFFGKLTHDEISKHIFETCDSKHTILHLKLL